MEAANHLSPKGGGESTHGIYSSPVLWGIKEVCPLQNPDVLGCLFLACPLSPFKSCSQPGVSFRMEKLTFAEHQLAKHFSLVLGPTVHTARLSGRSHHNL